MAEKRFQWHSEEYAGHSSAQYQWAMELIGKLRLAGHETLLDMGCGDGKITARMAEILPQGRAVGMDSSKSMIGLAASTFPRVLHPNLCFVIMDALYPGFQNVFDVIFSNAALHWVSDHRSMLKRMNRCLKPGGRIMLQMGGRGNAADILHLLDGMMKKEKWQSFFKDFSFSYGFYGPQDYEQWLSEAGFEIRRLELIPKDMTQTGIEGLKGWIRTTWLPYTQQVPDDLQEDFIDEIAETYIQGHPLDTRGNAHVQMMRLEAEALKAP